MNVGEFTLRPHQIRAIDEARQAVARLKAAGEPPRVLVVAPCGAGKTIMSSALIHFALQKDRTSAFFASGRQLIYQKSDKLNRAGISHAVLMAAEDDSYWHSNVLVASKDTYAARAIHSDRVSRESRDLWIVDEAHRAMAGEWMAILPQDNETVVIGFTATPALSNGRGMGGYYKALVQAATYRELIDAKLLTPCRVYAPWSVDTTGIKLNKDNDWSWKAVETRHKKLVGKVVETWQKIGEDRPTACFAQGVEHSIGLCQEFNAAGIPAVHIDADTPNDERNAAYKGLRDGTIKVVCNFGVLTVGWDEPCVSCGILAFATNSLVKFLQVAGRVLRIDKGKEDALIIDHGDNVRRHGWPTDDHEWSLDPRETVTVRDIKAREKANKQPEPICCPNCGAMRERGPKCLNCGHRHERSGTKVYNEAGELIEITRSKVKKVQDSDDLRREWMRCLAIAAHKGSNFYAAQRIFESRTGKRADGMKPIAQPHQMGVPVGVIYPGFIRKGNKSGSHS